MRTKYHKGKHLRAVYRALILSARKLGYKYKLVSGDNGWCIGGYTAEIDGNSCRIEIGRDQPLTDRLITLAHEIGHILDLSAKPPTIAEYTQIIRSWEDYSLGGIYYTREKAAWAQAKQLLTSMGGYGLVAYRFKQLRTRNLSSYYRKMRRHA